MEGSLGAQPAGSIAPLNSYHSPLQLIEKCNTQVWFTGRSAYSGLKMDHCGKMTPSGIVLWDSHGRNPLNDSKSDG